MAEIKIRVAQFNDQGRLGKLLLESLGPVWNDIHGRSKKAALPSSSAEEELMAADDWYFQNADLMNCVYFAWEGELPVGAVVVNVFTAELQFLVVLPSHRRQGIGSLLLKEAIAELKERGTDHLRIEIPLDPRLEGAEAFFTKNGFLPVKNVAIMGQRV